MVPIPNFHLLVVITGLMGTGCCMGCGLATVKHNIATAMCKPKDLILSGKPVMPSGLGYSDHPSPTTPTVPARIPQTPPLCGTLVNFWHFGKEVRLMRLS